MTRLLSSFPDRLRAATARLSGSLRWDRVVSACSFVDARSAHASMVGRLRPSRHHQNGWFRPDDTRQAPIRPGTRARGSFSGLWRRWTSSAATSRSILSGSVCAVHPNRRQRHTACGNLKALLNQVHNLASANVTAWRSHTSYRERIGLRHFAFLPARGPLQRLDRPGLIEVDHRVELVRQAGPEVVAGALRFGAGEHSPPPP